MLLPILLLLLLLKPQDMVHDGRHRVEESIEDRGALPGIKC